MAALNLPLLLQNRPSADPLDPELLALEQQAALVGRAPRRVSMTEEEQVALQQRANEICKEGQVCHGLALV